jgi:hypothetical protein
MLSGPSYIYFITSSYNIIDYYLSFAASIPISKTQDQRPKKIKDPRPKTQSLESEVWNLGFPGLGH